MAVALSAHVSVLNIYGDARKKQKQSIDGARRHETSLPPLSLHGTSSILHLGSAVMLQILVWYLYEFLYFPQSPLIPGIICCMFIVILPGGSRLILMCHNESGDHMQTNARLGPNQTVCYEIILMMDNEEKFSSRKIVKIWNECRKFKTRKFKSPYWRCQNV